MTGITRSPLALAAAQLAVWWQLAGHPLLTPVGALAIVAVALASILLVAVATGHPASSIIAGPLLRRAVALRRKSWGAVFQRQRDPDAAGRTRPRAPSVAPAAA